MGDKITDIAARAVSPGIKMAHAATELASRIDLQGDEWPALQQIMLEQSNEITQLRLSVARMRAQLEHIKHTVRLRKKPR